MIPDASKIDIHIFVDSHINLISLANSVKYLSPGISYTVRFICNNSFILDATITPSQMIDDFFEILSALGKVFKVIK